MLFEIVYCTCKDVATAGQRPPGQREVCISLNLAISSLLKFTL